MGKLYIPIFSKKIQKYTSSLSKQIKIKLNGKGLIWSHEWWLFFPFHSLSFGNYNLTVESTGFAFDISSLLCGLNLIVKCGWYWEKGLLNRPFSDNRSLLCEIHNSWNGYSCPNKKFSKIIFLLFTYHSHCPSFSRSCVITILVFYLTKGGFGRFWGHFPPARGTMGISIALEKGAETAKVCKIGNLWK